MATYNQISLINIPSTREGGVARNFEFRLLERDALGDDLPFDIEGPVEIQHGGQSDDILKPVKTTQALFRIKTESALSGKLIDAGSRQFYLTIRETIQNVMKFEGYIEPNFHQYDVFESVQTVQLKATGGLGTFGTGDATTELKTLKSVFTTINTELELTRDTDFYMRTRYDGQPLSDPVPERIWMTELGKLGEESGKRQAAVQQICQEFNLQILQHNGKLVVADVYERFKNPQAANVYRNGTTQETEDLLITLNETNVIDKIEDADHHPTGQKEIRIGRVVQQRRLPQRKESAFPNQSLPKVLSGTPYEIAYPGDFVAGDIVKIDEIAGTAQITPGYMPSTYPTTITVTFDMVQFKILDKDTQETLYYDSEISEWVATEKWVPIVHPYFELPESQQVGGVHYPTLEWSIPTRELPPIPENRRVSMTISLQEDFTIQQSGVDVDPGVMDTKLTAFNVPVTFNDTADDLYHQAITTNAPGEPRVYPLFESDFTDYSGESGTMYIGAAGDVYANNLWIEEGTANRVSFVELTAKRKAEILLGNADRIYLKVRALTPISLLNVLSFQAKNYVPAGIVEELFSGFQHVWMKPAPFLEYSYEEQFTYDPGDITATQNGPSRNWVDSRIGDGFQSLLGASAIAKTTATTGSGLVNAFQIDRQNLLNIGDEIYIVTPYSLNRYPFVVAADQGPSFTLSVEPNSVPGPIPTGSFVFPRGNVTSGVLRSRYATQILSEFAGVGILREAVDGVVESLPLYLFVKVRAGWTMKLINEDTGIVFTWTADGEEGQFYEGTVDVPLKQPQLIQAPAESRVTLGNTMLSAILHVDPGKILGKVEREAKGESIGTLSSDRNGIISNIELTDIDEALQVDDGQVLKIFNQAGNNEEVIVDGDQTLNPASPPASQTLLIVEKTLNHTYVAGHSWVREPSYKITGKLNITAGLTELNQTNISQQGTAIAGLTLDVEDANTAIVNLQASVENNEGAISQAYVDLQAYADDEIQSARAAIMADVDTEIGSAVAGLASESYVDSEVSSASASVLASAEQYTDNEVSSATAGLATQVYVNGEISQATTNIFAQADDTYVGITLFADTVNGGLITITGNTEFSGNITVDSTAELRSSDFNALNETGWRLTSGASSKLEVYNAEVWGTLKTTVLEKQMEVQGRISIPSDSDPKLFLDGTYGVWIRSNNTYQQGRALNFGNWNSGNPTIQARIWGHDTGAIRVESEDDVRLQELSTNAFIELSSIGRITLGGSDDIRFPNVPLASPGGSNRVLWRDSNGFARLT